MFTMLLEESVAALRAISGGRATYWLHLLLGARPLLRLAHTY
jgi:hypothetical protein